MKLIEAIGDLEQQMREDKKKIITIEADVEKEREQVLQQINNTVSEVGKSDGK